MSHSTIPWYVRTKLYLDALDSMRYPRECMCATAGIDVTHPRIKAEVIINCNRRNYIIQVSPTSGVMSAKNHAQWADGMKEIATVKEFWPPIQCVMAELNWKVAPGLLAAMDRYEKTYVAMIATGRKEFSAPEQQRIQLFDTELDKRLEVYGIKR